MRYVALAEGISNRKLIPENADILERISKNPDKDFYISLYKYNKEHFKKFQETHTLKGIKDVKTDKLFFDFDDSTDLEKARQDTLELYSRLVQHGIPNKKIGIYFSGDKGFHIEVNTNQEFNRNEFKNIVFNLAADLETFDPRINDEQRIIRVPLSKHQKTRLFKIPINENQLSETPIEMIQEMAKNLDMVETSLIDNWGNIELPQSILELKDVPYKQKSETNVIEDHNLSFDTDQLNFKYRPKWLSAERYALQEGFFLGSDSVGAGGGERNDAFMILAATYRGQGLNKKIAVNMLKATAKLQAARTGESVYPEEEIKRKVDEVYSPEWTGGTYSKDHELLVKTRKRFNIQEPKSVDEFVTNDDLFGDFADYALNIDQNTIKTGLPIDQLNEIRLTIGMPVALLGAPSSGKTTVALNILKNTSKNGMSSMFFSLDMHKALICQKQLQLIRPGHTSKMLYRNIHNPKWRKIYQDDLNKNFGNVHYCTRAGLTVDDIRALIEKKEEEIGEEIKLVVIDYLECIRGEYSDPTTNSAMIANGIKNIANELNKCVILLVQPPKMSGGAAYPLTNMYQIKGSSMVAQAMRVVIGIYREGFNAQDPSDDKFMTFVGLKNTMGSLFKLDCEWDGAQGKIRHLDDFQQSELEQLREKLEKERKKYGL